MVDINFLKNVRVLTELTREELKDISGLLSTKKYEAGNYVFKEGDKGDSLFIIEKGKVSISVKMKYKIEKFFESFGPKDVFGEMAFIDSKQRSASVVVFEPAVIHKLLKSDFEKLVKQRPAIACKIVAAIAVTLSNRLRAANEQMMSIVSVGLDAMGFK